MDALQPLVPLLDALPTALLEVTDDGTIARVNARAGALLGRARSELLGANVSDVLAPLPVLRAAEREQDTPRPRITLEGGAGPVVVYGFQLSTYLTLAGERHLVVFQDITEVARLSDERDRLLRLATVAEVLPAILHEVKNPLAAVTTAVEVLLDEEGSVPTAARQDLHGVLGELRRMRLTLDGVGIAGRSLLADRAQAADFTVREVTRVLEPRASSLGVSLSCSVETLPLVFIDAAALKAVLFNLVMNALQASRPGDRVALSCRLLEGGETFEVRVADTGAGMPPEVQRRCRELFFTTKPKGTGIGLALVDRLVREAGGELALSSSPGQGTTVTLRLPTRKPRPNTPR